MHNKLPNKYYFISNFDTKYINKQDKYTGIIYRNYNSKTKINNLIKFRNYCKNNGYKFYLSNNIKLAIKLDLDGAYIPSFNKDIKHLSFSYKKKFLIIGSAHNNKEIKIKELQNINILFLSSLFKKNKNFLGINKFKLLSKLSNKKIIALGGISNKNIKKLKLLNCFGYAGISHFEKKKAPKRGPFK